MTTTRRTERPKFNVRVIRDARDTALDYFLPAERARELFRQGKLLYDMTNDCYCTHNRWEVVR